MTIPTTSGDTPNSLEASTYSAYITEELRRYDEHLRDVRGLAAGTRKSRLRIIGRLLEGRFKQREIVIVRLHPDDVRKFLARRLAENPSASNASQHTVALRSYLRYRATCGDQVSKLVAVIANPVHWRLATLPRALSVEDADRLLGTAALARKTPKRAYAIVRLALDLGLRSSEIANLTINDIDWQAGTLMLRGTKSLRQDVIPLPEETGNALADYLQHERPAIRHPAVFVWQVAGRMLPITSCAVQKVIKYACRRIGLPDASAHSLRHTTAMHLLQAGVDISVIALWLGHESPVTTHHYIEADLAMKERALARLHEPSSKILRYRAPDSLLNFLRTL